MEEYGVLWCGNVGVCDGLKCINQIYKLSPFVNQYVVNGELDIIVLKL